LCRSPVVAEGKNATILLARLGKSFKPDISWLYRTLSSMFTRMEPMK
jgi:hypothetical protein